MSRWHPVVQTILVIESPFVPAGLRLVCSAMDFRPRTTASSAARIVNTHYRGRSSKIWFERRPPCSVAPVALSSVTATTERRELRLDFARPTTYAESTLRDP